MPQARKPKTPTAVRRAAQRSAEKALVEERLALAAIVKCLLAEVPDPERALRRIEAMVRQAESNPKTPVATRKMLLDGYRFIATAVERQLGKPQQLFDPHIGHMKQKDVDAVADLPEQGVQLGLGDGTLADVETAHGERVDTIVRVQTELVRLLKEHGALTDEELLSYYARAFQAEPQRIPALGPKDVARRRRELTASGRVLATGQRRSGSPLWDLVEREALIEGVR
jgi:hypothetical protein